MTLGYLLSMMGLIIDIAGGLLLAKSVFSRKPQRVFAESTPFYGINRYLFESGIEAAVEAKFSVPLLVLGFVGQLSGDYLETIVSCPLRLRSQIIGICVAILIVLGNMLSCHLRKKWWRKNIGLYFTIQNHLEDLYSNSSMPADTNILTLAKVHTGLQQELNEIDREYLAKCHKYIQKRLHIRDIKSNRDQL